MKPQRIATLLALLLSPLVAQQTTAGPRPAKDFLPVALIGKGFTLVREGRDRVFKPLEEQEPDRRYFAKAGEYLPTGSYRNWGYLWSLKEEGSTASVWEITTTTDLVDGSRIIKEETCILKEPVVPGTHWLSRPSSSGEMTATILSTNQFITFHGSTYGPFVCIQIVSRTLKNGWQRGTFDYLAPGLFRIAQVNFEGFDMATSSERNAPSELWYAPELLKACSIAKKPVVQTAPPSSGAQEYQTKDPLPRTGQVIWNGFAFGMSVEEVRKGIAERLQPAETPAPQQKDETIEIFRIDGTRGRYDALNIPSTTQPSRYGFPLTNRGMPPRVLMGFKSKLASISDYQQIEFFFCDDQMVIIGVPFSEVAKEAAISKLKTTYGAPKEILNVWARWEAFKLNPPGYVREETQHFRWETSTSVVDCNIHGHAYFIDRLYAEKLAKANAAIEAEVVYRDKQQAEEKKRKAESSLGL